MKQRSTRTATTGARWTLNAVAAAAVTISACLPLDAWALGLGRLSVQSALGEPLRAEVEVSAITPEEAASLQARVAAPDAFRAAGVEFNPALSGASVTLQRRPGGQPFLRIVSERTVQEPFVDVILQIHWSSGRLEREFTMLFDPPAQRNVAAAPPQAPAAIEPAPLPAPARAPRAERPAATPAPAAPSAAASAPAPMARPPAATAAAQPSGGTSNAGAEATAGADEYRVRRGDTLFNIATRTQRPGVSLDQMLVALFRNNGDAFLGRNMNRLKAGVVLSVPSAEQAGAVAPAEARQVIQAQSADFGAYRQKLAAGVPTAPAEGTAGAASGKVEAEVQDRKQAAAPSADKLTLSRGAVPAGKASAEEQIAQSRAQQENSARVAELAKNVDDLRRLQGAAAAGGSASAPASAPGALAVPGRGAPATAAPAPAVPPAVAAASDPASAPAPAVAAASAAAEPSSPASPASAAAAAPVPIPAADEPGWLDEALDHPLLVPGVAALVVLLAGLGLYRMRRHRHDSGETSFLESRLQPDSFFGASGGQRVDTRDATGVPSSMSYSLSQLDAIGDVDPVAEADVYLAYGRDLQAEEILKEAMRANPERMAIRMKLLEVYAKRRDTKGFELLAAQLFALTGGQGEDWQRAQQLGLGIDPDNPVYQPGGRPAGAAGAGPLVEPLGASTMPQSVLPSPSRFEAHRMEASPPAAVDLDLDVSAPMAFDDAPLLPTERTQPMVAAPEPAPLDAGLDFDLPSLDLDAPTEPPPVPSPSPESLEARALEGLPDLGSLDLPPGGEADEGLSRKLELAEEFRQIGDMEGARDLLQEVIAEPGAARSLKTRAQAMLKELA